MPKPQIRYSNFPEKVEKTCNSRKTEHVSVIRVLSSKPIPAKTSTLKIYLLLPYAPK